MKIADGKGVQLIEAEHKRNKTACQHAGMEGVPKPFADRIVFSYPVSGDGEADGLV
jgi:hypothetical protein